MNVGLGEVSGGYPSARARTRGHGRRASITGSTRGCALRCCSARSFDPPESNDINGFACRSALNPRAEQHPGTHDLPVRHDRARPTLKPGASRRCRMASIGTGVVSNPVLAVVVGTSRTTPGWRDVKRDSLGLLESRETGPNGVLFDKAARESLDRLSKPISGQRIAAARDTEPAVERGGALPVSGPGVRGETGVVADASLHGLNPAGLSGPWIA